MHTQPNTHIPIGPRVTTYVALISQSGTAAPTVQILQNTIGTITWTRTDVGSYQGTANGNLLGADKTTVICTSNGSLIYASCSNDTTITLQTMDTAGNNADDWLGRTPIQINVYN